MDNQLEAQLTTQPNSNDPDLVVITGMSGAGRTEAMHTFEDLGYFCIDNLPPSLLINLVSLAGRPDGVQRKLAVVCDLRAREFFPELIEELKKISAAGLTYVILFLDADTKALLSRFKATRRRHPLCDGAMTIVAGIEKERELLKEAQEIANYVIDTGEMKPQELRKQIRALFSSDEEEDVLRVSVFSFGFKHGMPMDADLLVDVRFLPNPYYIPELRSLLGTDEKVRDYVLGFEQTQNFLEKWFALLDVVMPGYVEEGKKYVSIGLGCTGGQHRSVTIAQQTYQYLKEKGFFVTITHRDIALAEVN